MSKQDKAKTLALKTLENLKAERARIRFDRNVINQLTQLDSSFEFTLIESRTRESTIVSQIIKLNAFIQQKFKSPILKSIPNSSKSLDDEWDYNSEPFKFQPISEKYPIKRESCGCSYYNESLLIACLEHA